MNEIFGDNEYLQHGVTLKPGRWLDHLNLSLV